MAILPNKKIAKNNTSQNLPYNFNFFPNKPWFLCVCSTSALKTLWEKEKLLMTSNSSFSQVFSTLLENFLPFSSNFDLSSANSFCLQKSKICHLGKGFKQYLSTYINVYRTFRGICCNRIIPWALFSLKSYGTTTIQKSCQKQYISILI